MKRKRRAEKLKLNRREIEKEVLEAYFSLFNLSKEIFKISPYLANKYIELLFNFRKKYKVGIPKEIKRFICRKCKNVLIAGINLKVRINSKNRVVEYICLNCGFIRRYKYK